MRALLFLAAFVCASVCALSTDHVNCPCTSPGALVQDVNLLALSVKQEVNDANATGTVEPGGGVNLVDQQPIDVEKDSICVCKRIRKPSAPIRCTKPGLLHENCGERDKMRAAGYEIAPKDKVETLYPDEIPRPADGKLFQDKEVEASAAKNLAVENKNLVGYVAHIQKPHAKKALTPKAEPAPAEAVSEKVEVHTEAPQQTPAEESPPPLPPTESQSSEVSAVPTDKATEAAPQQDKPQEQEQAQQAQAGETPSQPAESAPVQATPTDSTPAVVAPAAPETPSTPAPEQAVAVAAPEPAQAQAQAQAQEATQEVAVQAAPQATVTIKEEELEALKKQIAELQDKMQKLAEKPADNKPTLLS